MNISFPAVLLFIPYSSLYINEIYAFHYMRFTVFISLNEETVCLIISEALCP